MTHKYLLILILIWSPYSSRCLISSSIIDFKTLENYDDVDYEKPVERTQTIYEETLLKEGLKNLKSHSNESFDSTDEQLKIEQSDDDEQLSEELNNSNQTSTGDKIHNNSSYDADHSEIESTTLASIFDNLNFTLPSLTRMIEMSEQGELDILNKTQPRRLMIDMDSSEEIIGMNDIDKLLADPNLHLDPVDDYPESEILRSPSGEDCGQRRFNNQDQFNNSRTGRILGGTSTYPGEIPWIHPSLGQVGHWCSGVLINSQWIITASHCIINPLFHLTETIYWEVRLGKHNINKNENTQRTYQIAKLFNIKQYRGYDNDLALLKLQTMVETTDYIRPICLPTNEYFDFSNAECFVAGWGKVDYNKKGADVLQKVKMNIYDNIDCQRVYYPKFRIMIKNWHLCAGNKSGGKGTCHGDSGGPLQCHDKSTNRWYLAGITSFGSNCSKVGFPDAG